MATPVFIDRIDAAPVLTEEFDYSFTTWLAVLVNVLNENMSDIQNYFNLLTAQSYTQTEILAMQAESPAVLDDGVLLYDSTNDLYVGRQAGSLVQFTTSSYP